MKETLILKETLLVGKTENGGAVEIEIEIRPTPSGPELSMVGNVWKPSRRDIDAGGQLQRDIWEYLETLYVPSAMLERVLEVWERWHLNGMKAACRHQRLLGWDKMKMDDTKDVGWHVNLKHANLAGWVRPDEDPKGVLGKDCPQCGYKYGTAWLHEELPAEIIDEIKSWFAGVPS